LKKKKIYSVVSSRGSGGKRAGKAKGMGPWKFSFLRAISKGRIGAGKGKFEALGQIVLGWKRWVGSGNVLGDKVLFTV